MTSLQEKFEACVALVMPTLQEACSPEKYAVALETLGADLLQAERGDLDALDVTTNTRGSLWGDRRLMETVILNRPDQASLLSTLVIYEACAREGMRDHSRVYMDRVSALRKLLDIYYGETTRQFCGS